MQKQIRVLVVDDSLFFRESIAKGIAADRGIEVVGTAGDPFEARDKIIELEPDVLSLDVEMPRMNGIEFIRKLMPQYPLPVVVVSAVTDSVFEALDAGAVDFVTKPDARTQKSAESFINELIIKIKIASTAKVGHYKREYRGEQLPGALQRRDTLIAMGASTGGTEAIYEILRAFPRDMPGIVVTQHMPPVFTKMYAQRLNKVCKMEVKEAEHGDLILPGRVLIAPGDYQMRVKRNGATYFVECSIEEKVSGHSPSVDVLFHSVAECADKSAIGVILTGMGFDGAKGMLNMKQKGALTIGQDEQSCVVYGMPKVAYDIGAVSKQMHLNNMPKFIYNAVTGNSLPT